MKVKGVTNSSGVAPVGFVDVQVLVNQLDGWNNATAHGTIYNLPRISGSRAARTP
ncbi:MAG: hypothetical protein PW999_00810 [Paraburkholderia tropica]|nr:hypothetical protein [Paraburkholderia tropica]